MALTPSNAREGILNLAELTEAMLQRLIDAQEHVASSNEKLAAAMVAATAAGEIRQNSVMASIALARDAINQHTTIVVKNGGSKVWLAVLASATTIAAGALAVIASK